jgi:hypothetical protein
VGNAALRGLASMQTSTSCPLISPPPYFGVEVCALSALCAVCVEVCALCAIRVRLGGVFAVFWFWSAEGLQTGWFAGKKR